MLRTHSSTAANRASSSVGMRYFRAYGMRPSLAAMSKPVTNCLMTSQASFSPQSGFPALRHQVKLKRKNDYFRRASSRPSQSML
ncbi:MAG: hypothetical protein K6E38_08670, partial [Fretibacterium sp.]|nr:hypothetical protein [Fretibacterium sp.]